MAIAAQPWIGTLRERPLHAALKRWCAQPGDRTEVAVDGYVIDLVRGDLLIEVQTRGLSSARHKVATLLDRGHRLRLVLPIAVEMWIVKVDAEGVITSRRRSPRHGHRPTRSRSWSASPASCPTRASRSISSWWKRRRFGGTRRTDHGVAAAGRSRSAG